MELVKILSKKKKIRKAHEFVSSQFTYRIQSNSYFSIMQKKIKTGYLCVDNRYLIKKYESMIDFTMISLL